ncbi:hypothetical protein [Cellulomonas sp. P5_C5]
MPPASQGPDEDPLIDSAAQLAELTDLVARGLVSPEEFELQRRKVIGDAEASSPFRKESHRD